MSNQQHSTTQAQDQPENVSPHPNEDTRDLRSRPNDAANDHQAADEGLSDQNYPPQLHAGKVGLGPHYGEQNRVTIGEQITGVRETIKGKFKHDHDLEERGHERITGELKRKERQEQNDPFKDKDTSGAGAAKDDPKQDEMPGDDQQQDRPQQQQQQQQQQQ